MRPGVIGNLVSLGIFSLSQGIVLHNLTADFEEGVLLVDRLKVVEESGGYVGGTVVKGLNKV